MKNPKVLETAFTKFNFDRVIYSQKDQLEKALGKKENDTQEVAQQSSGPKETEPDLPLRLKSKPSVPEAPSPFIQK